MVFDFAAIHKRPPCLTYVTFNPLLVLLTSFILAGEDDGVLLAMHITPKQHRRVDQYWYFLDGIERRVTSLICLRLPVSCCHGGPPANTVMMHIYKYGPIYY